MIYVMLGDVFLIIILMSAYPRCSSPTNQEDLKKREHDLSLILDPFDSLSESIDFQTHALTTSSSLLDPFLEESFVNVNTTSSVIYPFASDLSCLTHTDDILQSGI